LVAARGRESAAAILSRLYCRQAAEAGDLLATAASVSGLIDTDWSSSFPGYWANGGANTTNGALFETVFELSQSVTFGQYWTLSNAFFNAYSNDVADGRLVPTPFGPAQCAMTNCSGYSGLVWDEVKLALNDSFTGWPITFNPYVTFFYPGDGIPIRRRGRTRPGRHC
jgi:hypothetical protein